MSYANESITQSRCRDSSDYEHISHIKMAVPRGGTRCSGTNCVDTLSVADL